MLLCTVSEESKRSVGVVPAAVLGAVASRYTVASLEELKRSVGVVPAVVLGAVASRYTVASLEELKQSVGVVPVVVLGAVASRYTLASLEELKQSVMLACSGSTSSCASVWIFSPSRESVKNSHNFSSCNSLRILSLLKTMFDGHTVIIKGLIVEKNLTSSVFS